VRGDALFNKTIDANNRLLVPVLNMDKTISLYKTRPEIGEKNVSDISINGLNGEIIYDICRNTFLGYFQNKNKYMEIGGGSISSENGLTSILCVEKGLKYEPPNHEDSFDLSGIHFYIDTDEDSRNKENSIMKLLKYNNDDIYLNLNGNIICKNNLDVSDIDVSNNLLVENNCTILNKLDVSGVDISNNLLVENNCTILNNLDVSGVDISNNLLVGNDVTIRNNTLIHKKLDVENIDVSNNIKIYQKLDVSRVDISQVLIIPRRHDENYKKDGNGSGISGEIYYDDVENKFFGNYGNDKGFKQLGGGSMSNSGNISILSLDKIDNINNTDSSGIYFYIDTPEDDRITDVSLSVMKLEKDLNQNIILSINGDISCNGVFDVSGDIHVENGTIYVESGQVVVKSDKRLKKDIKNINNSLELFKNIRGVEYKWNDLMKKHHKSISTTEKQYGVIAQEVEKYIPEIIKKNRYGFKMVNYTKLIPFLLEGIKSQQNEINQLKEENKNMKYTMDKILERLNNLEQS